MGAFEDFEKQFGQPPRSATTALDQGPRTLAVTTAEERAMGNRDRLASGALVPGWGTAALSGLVPGGGDEMIASTRSLFGGTDYDLALAQERANLAKYRDEHPYRAAGAEIGGASPWMIPAIMRGQTAPTTLLRATAAGAARGGVQGAMQGFGEGEGGVGDRALGALKAAPVAAAIGAAAVPVLSGAAAVLARPFDWARTAITGSGARDAAEAKVLQGVERRGDLGETERELADYAAREQERRAAGLPSPALTFGEVGGPQTQSQTNAVMTIPSRGAGNLQRQLDTRQTGRLERTDDALTATFGDLEGPYRARMALYDQRSTQGGPLYRQAFDGALPLEAADMDALRRVPRGAIAEAQNIAQMDGRRLSFNPQFDDEGRMVFPDGAARPTAEDMHHIKVGLDTYVENNTSVDGRTNTAGRAADRLRDALRDRLDNLTPHPDDPSRSLYREARETWAGPSAQIDAVHLGRRAAAMDPEELHARMARMTPEEQQSVVVGWMGDLRDKLRGHDQTGNANPVRAVFKNDKQREAAETMLSVMGLTREEARARFRRLSEYFDDELTGARSENVLLRNSKTASTQEAVRDLRTGVTGGVAGGVLAPFLGMDPLSGAALLGGASAITRRGIGAVSAAGNEHRNNAIATLLGGDTPELQASALEALRRRAAMPAAGGPRVWPGVSWGAGTAGQVAATPAGVPPIKDPRYQPQ